MYKKEWKTEKDGNFSKLKEKRDSESKKKNELKKKTMAEKKEQSEHVVLCGASNYEEKYYLNPAFSKLPDSVKDELKIMCVLFTVEVGGILTLEYKKDGTLCFQIAAAENDILYDEIGAGLKIKEYQRTKRELLEALELYYRVLFLHEKVVK